MSAAPTPAPSTTAAAAPRARWWRLRPRRRLIAAGALVLAASGVVAAVTFSLAGGSASSGVVDNGAATSLATVVRRSLTSQIQSDATLGYAGSYSVVNQARGTVTALPSAGRVITQGQSLYKVDSRAIVLLYGSTPAYRSLSKGMSGDDVRQLNADLVALGYATSSELDPTSDEFGAATKSALKKLQADLGLSKTGTLTLGQAVFLPGAVRIKVVSATLGSPAAPGSPVLQATSTRRRVTIELDAALQSQVKVGDGVTITLPDNGTTPGVVSSVGRVATSSSSGSSDSNSSPTVDVIVRPLHPTVTGRLDQAPVSVSITTASVRNALVVPVNALLALAGGGYAVEEVTPAGVHKLVPVELGLFDDAEGLVQVSGSGLHAGQRIVVPAA
jgi:peptidoglycan hydrolase-like protein with peptidoglycan-binding domain